MHIYAEKNYQKVLTPRPTTIRFILDYSKSLRVIKTKDRKTIELHLN